jgi:uncharacterized OB-fold protein
VPAKRDQDFFWEGVDRGELLAQRCLGCATLRHPPAPGCAACGSPDWAPQRLSGRGAIHTWIVSRHPTDPDSAPRWVILVDLAEGLRLVSNLIDVENIALGAPVAVEFGLLDGRRVPLFRTLPGAAAQDARAGSAA